MTIKLDTMLLVNSTPLRLLRKEGERVWKSKEEVSVAEMRRLMRQVREELQYTFRVVFFVAQGSRGKVWKKWWGWVVDYCRLVAGVTVVLKRRFPKWEAGNVHAEVLETMRVAEKLALGW